MRYELLLLFILNAFSLKAQIAEVNIAQIALINPNNKSAELLLDDNSEKCVRILGKPDEISDYYSEMDDDTMKLYRYGKSKLYFLKGKLSIWDVRDGRIWVGQVNGQIFKIGDTLTFGSARPTDFLGLTITHYAGESRNMNFAFASINEVKNGPFYLDSYFELLFDSKGTLFSICKGDK
jgi:hypothetical protein